MSAPNELVELVTRFKENLTSYKNPNYNETQVRREFIDPLFGLLGWDVANKEGYAEAYKEVIHEYSQKTKDSSEAPDYLFRIGGIRKFFVEAKKPSVNLKDDPNPAFQVRRYAWSAKLPLSILTDFEEFIVYDCRLKPVLNDKPSNGRILYYTFEDYLTKWEEIYAVFSREAVLKGSFDKFADSKRNKKGTAEVDDEFLSEIENWREHLAKNLALRNPELSSRELNFAVQKTIDRIIFLRICEDRGIEDYGQLLNLLNGANIYKRLLQIFTAADQKYNSGLFYFDQEKNRSDYPDTISHKLNIDDKTLKDIIKKLYYPESPYEFSVLPADILGHVYEQFLGKVIRLTAGHRAIVEEKPEVKKAGGVYYTPTYIVEYIVRNTLGVKLDEIYTQQNKLKNKVDETSKLKVLDPACGSGSFLLGAYQYLLDWHLKLYSDEFGKDNFIPKKESPVYKAVNNELKLTTAERKRILLNNIFGVDIDSQAVEVTKLSLMLKVLEGETGETLNTQMSMFRQRALPDLGNNIKCGNSLIGPDFYDQMEMNFLDEEGKYKINVFDWHSEFKEIFNNGGFDVVIGNPPYLKLTKNSLTEPILNYYENKYKTISGGSSKNLFQLFIERVLGVIKPQFFSFIVPEALLVTSSNKILRDMMILESQLNALVTFDNNVFEDANIGTTIFILRKNQTQTGFKTKIIKLKENDITEDVIKYESIVIGLDTWDTVSEKKFDSLLLKIENETINLGMISKMSKGMVVHDRQKHLFQSKVEGSLPFLLGSSISRYFYKNKFYAKYDELNIIGGTRDYEKQTRVPRILIRRTGNKICAVHSVTVELIESTLYILTSDNVDLNYLIGVLNSRLLTFYLQQKLITNIQGYPQILMWQLEKLPIKILNIDITSNISKLTIRINDLIAKLNTSSLPQEKQTLQRQIEATDKQIDKLVYELYGLTEEEIQIVEASK